MSCANFVCVSVSACKIDVCIESHMRHLHMRVKLRRPVRCAVNHFCMCHVAKLKRAHVKCMWCSKRNFL